MKRRDYLLSVLEAFLFTAALCIGNLFCLVTAFGIPVDGGGLVWLCIFTALVTAFVFAEDKIRIAKFAVFVLIAAVIILYNRHSIRDGFWISANRLGDVYSEAYRWKIDFGSVLYSEFGGATHFLAAVGVLLCCVSSWTICGRHQLWVLCTVSAALLVPCLMVVFSPPSPWAVVMLTVTYALLLMTQSRRRVNAGGRYGLSFGLLLPVLTAAMIITSALNPSAYQRSERMERLRAEFRNEIQKRFLIRQNQSTGGLDFISPFTDSTLGSYVWNTGTSEVDLSAIGPQRRSGQHAMDVLYTRGGLIYLRGNSFAVYEENGWHAMEEEEYRGVNIPDSLWLTSLNTEDEVAINTARRSSVFYLPYIPTDLPDNARPYHDAYVENAGGVIEYSIPISISAQYIDTMNTTAEYDAFVMEKYTRVPEETREALADIVSELETRRVDEGRPAADIVREYVSGSATYSLNTSRMPEGEEFVSWFLRESDTGYCVHFATSAAVLLRCMGIPARYVNGYMVNADPANWTDVTQNEAHAWVEYYTEGYGWRMLEVTPASSETEDTEIDEGEQEQQQYEQETQPETDTNTESITPRRENNNSNETEAETDGKSGTPLRVTLVILSVIAVIILWSFGLREVRKRILAKGTINERTVACYRHVRFLSGLAHEKIPEEIEGIALKARFSQHIITDGELGMVRERAEALTRELNSDKNMLKTLLYKIIFAL